MNYSEARYMAEWLVNELKPGCVRIEIGGGLRRGKADVHDIEIIAVPLISTTQDLFGFDAVVTNHMDECYLRRLEDLKVLKRVKGGEKFKQFEIGRWEEFAIVPPAEPFKLDLFLVTPPASWGVQFVLRTGPADFSKWMVTKKIFGGALPNYLYVKDGAVWDARDEKKIVTPEEVDFFELCGLKWVEPGKRAAGWKK